jgi:hypothetical protein
MSELELAHLVEHAVELIRPADETRNRTRTWDVLLGIIAYSYSIGLYASEEIEEALNDHPAFGPVQTLAFGNRPAAGVLRSFRRAHRDAIALCLAEVFRSACSRALGSMNSSGGPSQLVCPALDPSREANARITRAIQADSWAMDI